MRRAALRLCSIYGLAAEPLRLGADGETSVVLDGLDPERKIGFDLRGFDDLDWSSEALLEESSIALDEGELTWLDTQGFRVFVADVVRFRKLDGDQFTATLACLSGLVAFLNEVTEGEDVALGGFLFEREANWPLFAADRPLPDGVRRFSEFHEHRLVVERPVKITIPCSGLLDFGPPVGRVFEEPAEQSEREERVRFPSSTRGAPSVLNLCGGVLPLDGALGGHQPSFLLRIRQRLGEDELVHETDRYTLFLPGSFDLAQPFELDLELSPGRYTFYGPARIGAAAAR